MESIKTETRYLITSQNLLKRLSSISDEINYRDLNKNIFLSSNNPKVVESIENLKQDFIITTFDQVLDIGNQLPVCDFPITDPNELTLVVYTSGTTGILKGLMLNHKNLMTEVHNLINAAIERETPILDFRYPVYLYGFWNVILFTSLSKINVKYK